MAIHERTAKWSKGVREMDVLSLQEKELVCNKVAKQLFIICITIGTLILIAITFGMLEYPWLLEYMTNTADTVRRAPSSAHLQSSHASGGLTSVFSILPLLAVMLIPTLAVFFMIKKPLLRMETKKLLDNDSLADENDLLTQIIWQFTPNEYVSNEAFTKDIIDYIEDNRENWVPNKIALKASRVHIVYEAFITGLEQLRINETVLDMSTLDEECRIDGMFQTDIQAYLTADNGKYFTNVELLRKIHNQLAYKDLGNNDFLEGLEYIETDGGTSIYRLMTGS
ncbi:hypothetical protein [uncultured Veillonella sp.]|uniref:hypothetical protein n=1 Tax=uncultured Veillonella sp. TaxID=159268 RepID=UPI00262BABEA|nr:hypothetical protein [uncultured Veillonella sp.]